MLALGDVAASSTLRIPFNTNAVAGESITIGTNGTIAIYKDGSTTERSSGSGVTFTEDHDSHTGTHVITIDLSDNADAGFYAAGSQYLVKYHTATIDSKSISAWVGTFTIDKTRNKVDTVSLSGTSCTARDIGASVLLSSGTGTGQLDFTSGVVKANVVQYGGSAGTFSSGRPEVNTTHLAGTSQTARDIGASVLISSGTGSGQLDVTSGRIKADTVYWNGSAVATPTTAGVPEVDVTFIQGSANASLNILAVYDTDFTTNYTLTEGWKVDVVRFGGTAGSFASGRPAVNTTHIAGTSVATGTAQLGVNVVNWRGTAVAAPTVAGVPEVDVNYLNGAAYASTGIGQIDDAYALNGYVDAQLTLVGQSDVASAVWTNVAISSRSVNVTQISGDSVAADNAESFFDGTGYAGTNNVIPLVTLATTTTNLTNDPSGVTTLLSRLSAARAGYLDNLSAGAVATSAEITALSAAIPTANANADALLDRADAIETGITLRKAMRAITAANAGKLSGADGLNVLIRNLNDTKNVIDATVDAYGNRTSVTLDLT